MSNAPETLAQQIRKVFVLNALSVTINLPAEMARKHGLQRGEHALITDTKDGILIKKLRVET